MTSLTALPDPHDWAHYLKLVLLAIHTTIKEDLGSSSIKITFGTTLRWPEDFVCPNYHNSSTPREALASQLKKIMHRIAATPRNMLRNLCQRRSLCLSIKTLCGNPCKQCMMGLLGLFTERSRMLYFTLIEFR